MHLLLEKEQGVLQTLVERIHRETCIQAVLTHSAVANKAALSGHLVDSHPPPVFADSITTTAATVLSLRGERWVESTHNNVVKQGEA